MALRRTHRIGTILRFPIRPIATGLTRLALTLLVGSALAFALGLQYQVQRELDLIQYENASLEFELEGTFPVDAEKQLIQALGPQSCLQTVWATEFRSTTSVIAPAELRGLSAECSSAHPVWPDAALVQKSATSPEQWIDLNADAAKALGVYPGDTVSVFVAPDLPEVAFTVRGIYAVRGMGAAAFGLTSASVLFRATSTEGAGYGTALTNSTPAEFMPKLERPPLREVLIAAKGYPPVVIDRDSRLAEASDNSANSLGLVRTIGALAVLGVGALALREFDVFRKGCLKPLDMLHRLGVDRPRLAAVYMASAALIGTVSLLGGLAISFAAYSQRILASCFPPTLHPTLVWLAVGSVLLSMLASALAWVSLRKRAG